MPYFFRSVYFTENSGYRSLKNCSCVTVFGFCSATLTVGEPLGNVSSSANHNFRTSVTGISSEIAASYFFLDSVCFVVIAVPTVDPDRLIYSEPIMRINASQSAVMHIDASQSGSSRYQQNRHCLFFTAYLQLFICVIEMKTRCLLTKSFTIHKMIQLKHNFIHYYCSIIQKFKFTVKSVIYLKEA